MLQREALTEPGAWKQRIQSAGARVAELAHGTRLRGDVAFLFLRQPRC
jgi:hypothetical protein